MRCINCNKEIQDDARFCTVCGTRVPRCPTCGKLLLRRARFCTEDGTPIPDEINALIPEEQPPVAVAPVQPAPPKPAPVPVPPKPVPPKPTPVPVPPQTPPAAQKKKNTGLMVVLLAVVLLAAMVGAAILAMKWIRSGGLNGPEEETVMQEPTEATAPLETDPVEETEAVTETVPETEPEEETTPMVMPDLVNMDAGEAEEMLAAMGCAMIMEYAYSDEVAEGRVIRQSIDADSALYPEDTVALLVSKGPDVAPEGYNQKVVVTAAAGSSYGTLTLYSWKDGGWNSEFSCDATLGKNGIGADYGEGKKKTPQGVFRLGIALSADSIPNDGWPLQIVTSDTCVVDDTASGYYNTIQSISKLPDGVSYDPIGNTLIKGKSSTCIYIEHNGNGRTSENVVAGKGSVITICGRTAAIEPTAGCVDISSANMTTLLSKLVYEDNPHIEILVQ